MSTDEIETKKCSFCAKEINVEDIVCQFCKSELKENTSLHDTLSNVGSSELNSHKKTSVGYVMLIIGGGILITCGIIFVIIWIISFFANGPYMH